MLYEVITKTEPLTQEPAAEGPIVGVPARGSGIFAHNCQACHGVITSYSIHYTKLYETTKAVFAGAHMPFTLAFTTFGFVGLSELYRRDRSVFWLLLLVFLTTGPALMGYMIV